MSVFCFDPVILLSNWNGRPAELLLLYVLFFVVPNGNSLFVSLSRYIHLSRCVLVSLLFSFFWFLRFYFLSSLLFPVTFPISYIFRVLYSVFFIPYSAHHIRYLSVQHFSSLSARVWRCLSSCQSLHDVHCGTGTYVCDGVLFVYECVCVCVCVCVRSRCIDFLPLICKIMSNHLFKQTMISYEQGSCSTELSREQYKIRTWKEKKEKKQIEALIIDKNDKDIKLFYLIS